MFIFWGTFTIELSKYVKCIDAIDSSNEMIKIAKEKSKNEEITNVNWECNDILKLDSINKKYNIVTAYNLLLYLHNPEELISSIYNTLDDDEYFISVTDCMGESKNFKSKIEMVFSKLGIIPYMNSFKSDKLKELIKKSGLEIVISKNYHTSPPNYFIVAKKQ